MRKNRRIGTLTSGITLIAFGLFFLIYTFFPDRVSLQIALNCWPITLILLGIELLTLRFSKDTETEPKFDIASVFLMLLCIMFGFGCEVARIIITNYA